MKSKHYSATSGIEWSGNLAEDILENMDKFSLIEFIPENFFSKEIDEYKTNLFNEIKKRQIPIIVHATQLSMGSLEPFKKDHWHKMIDICKELPVQSWSDHLCMTEIGGKTPGQLTPTFYNDDTLVAISEKIKYMQSCVEEPIALENIASAYHIPQQKYSETEFINLLQERTGMKLLLDLNNLYVNAMNFGIDPYQYIRQINPETIDSVHLAGGFMDEDNFAQDGHNNRVPKPVWELYEYLLQYANRRLPTIVERTGDNEAGIAPIVEDITKAQSILDKTFESDTLIARNQNYQTSNSEMRA